MSRPGHPIHFRDARARLDSAASTHQVHRDPDGSGLEMSVIVVAAGQESSREVDPGFDELLYVLSGTGDLITSRHTSVLSKDTGALINGASGYALRAGDTPLEVVAVSGPTNSGIPCGDPVQVIDLAGQEKEAAVSKREFQIVFDPTRGCSGMTQFVGYVPAIRTPRHFHPYDEMLFVVRGHGTVEIEGRAVEVGPGSAYYLPAGCVHLVENTEEDFLVELGVFTPAGSPTQNTPVE